MTATSGLHVERSALAWRRTVLAAVAGSAVTLRLAVSHDSAALCSVVVVAAALLAIGGLIARTPERRACVLVVAVAATGVAVSVDVVVRALGL